MSGRDRRHYLRELRAAEQEQRSLMVRADAAYRVAHGLICQEWSARQFIGGPIEPFPTITQALHGGYPLLEVRCKRCGHESLVDLRQAIWPRGNRIHTLAKVLRCQRCRDERKSPPADLVALRMPEGPTTPAKRVRG